MTTQAEPAQPIPSQEQATDSIEIDIPCLANSPGPFQYLWLPCAGLDELFERHSAKRAAP